MNSYQMLDKEVSNEMWSHIKKIIVSVNNYTFAYFFYFPSNVCLLEYHLLNC